MITVLSDEDATLQTVINKEEPIKISIDDFALGDHVVLFLGEIQESYPTRAEATTIQLEPNETSVTAYPIQDLWNASRTKYVGDNSAVGKLIGLLPVPMGMQYDHFELQTSSSPIRLNLYILFPHKPFQNTIVKIQPHPIRFGQTPFYLLALIEIADEIQVTLKMAVRKLRLPAVEKGLTNAVEGEVSDYGKSFEKLQELKSKYTV